MLAVQINEKWWKSAIFYQIYPKSFMDSNGDGTGDIRGIIDKLDYLHYLGVNAVWLSPVFLSPMKDNGYDISDYYCIHPDFGTIEDMKMLISRAKAYGIRMIIDLVVNHCSDQHIWFREALSNPDSPYRDYFIIKKVEDQNEPNNWRSVFGGSVWEKFGDNDGYYYHTFTKEQPDLNWENPNLRKDIYKMMNYWLEMGIDGFRIDAITFIKKDLSFRCLEPDGVDGLVGLAKVSENYPGIEVFLSEMKRETYGRYDSFAVAEISRPDDEMVRKFIGMDGVFDSIFDFSYLDLDVEDGKWYKTHSITAKEIRDTMFRTQSQAQRIGGCYSTVLQNHDQNRFLNKYFEETDISYESASMLATLNLTLRGVPFLYQGEEIGMTNRNWENWDEIDDVSTYGQYQMALTEGVEEETAFAMVTKRSRDNARTPMQWNKRAEAGFTTGCPCIPVNENFVDINVEAQMENPDSLLQYYRKLIALRKSNRFGALLGQGEIKPLILPDDSVIAYERCLNDERLIIVLNYDRNEKHAAITALSGGELLLGNYSNTKVDDQLQLRPYEALVCSVKRT